MKVGILGSGDVAKALAAGFLKHGHNVIVGTRDQDKLTDWLTQQRGARVSSFAEAAKFGEVVVLAVKGTVALEALRAAGAANLAGKPALCLDTSAAWLPTRPSANSPTPGSSAASLPGTTRPPLKRWSGGTARWCSASAGAPQDRHDLSHNLLRNCPARSNQASGHRLSGRLATPD